MANGVAVWNCQVLVFYNLFIKVFELFSAVGTRGIVVEGESAERRAAVAVYTAPVW